MLCLRLDGSSWTEGPIDSKPLRVDTHSLHNNKQHKENLEGMEEVEDLRTQWQLSFFLLVDWELKGEARLETMDENKGDEKVKIQF